MRVIEVVVELFFPDCVPDVPVAACAYRDALVRQDCVHAWPIHGGAGSLELRHEAEPLELRALGEATEVDQGWEHVQECDGVVGH